MDQELQEIVDSYIECRNNNFSSFAAKDIENSIPSMKLWESDNEATSIPLSTIAQIILWDKLTWWAKKYNKSDQDILCYYCSLLKI